MRLLIYLLALISGFSAAEAARSQIAPASSVAQSAVSAAEALTVQAQVESGRHSNDNPNAPAFALPIAVVLVLAEKTPVSRYDLTRE